MKKISSIVAIILILAGGCAVLGPEHIPPVESTTVDDFSLIDKGELFIGTDKNLLPSRHQYLLKGTNGYLRFNYQHDFKATRLKGQWQGKTLEYDNNSRTIDWQLYDLRLTAVTSGATRVSYGGWKSDSGIPFDEIQKIINIQPFVRVGEFILWNEIYNDYAWVTFGTCNPCRFQSLAILPEGSRLTQSLARRLVYYDIRH